MATPISATDPGMCILVINPNTSEKTTRMLEALANESLHGTGMHAVGVTVAVGPSMITDPVSLRDSVGHVVTAARLGVAVHSPIGVIVGAIGDPGVADLRAELSIPVIGIGEACIAQASKGGRRFGMVTTTAALASSLRALVAQHAPEQLFTGLRLTASAAELLSGDPAAQHAELADAVTAATDLDGAAAVIIGGGPLSETARQLAALSTVPIIEPIPSAVACILASLANDETADDATQPEPVLR